MTPSMLIVCVGNTCRSPMAEALAKRKWPKARIQSAGIHVAQEGDGPAEEAIVIMRSLNLDISGHKTVSIHNVDLTSFQVILALDKGVRRKLIELGVDEHKIFNMFVKDPFHGDSGQYLKCANEIKKKLSSLTFDEVAHSKDLAS